ncbi:MAG: serine/threonine-protein kinase, partial [Chloroflexota bacterium]
MIEPQQYGRYQVKTMLGRGGMATVYHAYDPQFDGDVAVKVIDNRIAAEAEFRTRFRREAQVIKQIHHSAIVPIYDMGEQNGQMYYVMQYMSNGSLSERLKQAPLPLAEIINIFERIASALDMAHQQRVYHRDIKPANILLDQDGRAYLSDFGIARVEEAADHTSRQTQTLIGTPQYMAPEQFLRGEFTWRTDMYQLGVTLFQLLTGVLPYTGTTPFETGLKHVQEPIPSVRQHHPLLLPEVDAIVQKAMAKEPSQRFQSAHELVNALKLIGQQRPFVKQSAHKKANEQAAGGKRPFFRRPESWLVAGGLLLLCGLISFLLFSAAGSDSEAEIPHADMAVLESEVGLPTSAAHTLVPETALEKKASPKIDAYFQQAGREDNQLIWSLENIKLAHESEEMTSLYFEQVLVQDFQAIATFQNPYSADTDAWDYGFLLREQGDEAHLRLYVTSEQTWRLVRGATLTLAEGELGEMILRRGSEDVNVLRVQMQGDQLDFTVNDSDKIEIDMVENPEFVRGAGRIGVGTRFEQGNGISDSTTLVLKFDLFHTVSRIHEEMRGCLPHNGEDNTSVFKQIERQSRDVR